MTDELRLLPRLLVALVLGMVLLALVALDGMDGAVRWLRVGHTDVDLEGEAEEDE